VIRAGPDISSRAVDMALPLRQTLRNAEYVFVGKVVKRGAATMPLVPADPTTAVVEVDTVLHSPPAMRFIQGKSVTVVTKDATSPKTGLLVIFLAKGWLYGESIAMIEVAHESFLDVSRAELSEHLMKENAAIGDDALLERLRLADVVVAGKVVATRELPMNLAAASEHSPVWSEATVDPLSFEKGDAPGGEVRFLFAASRDVKWHRSPKPAVGEQGVWLLHRQYVEEIKDHALTMLDRLDAQPIAALPRVRALVRR